jgi:hypothetical protein
VVGMELEITYAIDAERFQEHRDLLLTCLVLLECRLSLEPEKRMDVTIAGKSLMKLLHKQNV